MFSGTRRPRLGLVYTCQRGIKKAASGAALMYEQIIEFGLIKLAVVAVVCFVGSFCKAAWDSGVLRDSLLLRRAKEATQQPVDDGWTAIVQEPAYRRTWKSLTGRRGSTSVEVRQDRLGVK